MSDLEAIVFTADYIEPGRKILPNFKLIRSMAFVDLDEAVYLILKNTLSYLSDEKKSEAGKEKEIDEHSVEAYKYYKKIHGRLFCGCKRFKLYTDTGTCEKC